MYNNSMAVTIFFRYAVWHYTEAPRLLYGVLFNIIWFIGHTFSLATLWRSLFSPWRRIVAKRHRKWDFEDMASAILANTVSRIIGVVMRLTLIIVGLTLQFFFLVFSLALYVTWFVIPLLLAATFVYGLSLVFSV